MTPFAMPWESELGIGAPSLANIFCVAQARRIRDGDAGTASVPMELPYQGEI